MNELLNWLLQNWWVVLIIYFTGAITLFVLTFVCFAALMLMKVKQDEIFARHWSVRWLCYLILIVGLVFDTLLNWLVLTVSFLELPQEFLSTARVTRHKYDSTHWRETQARWWCENWLEPFDIGHCNK